MVETDGLEKVVNAGARFETISHIQKDFVQDPTNPDCFNNLFNYVLQTRRVNQQQADAMVDPRTGLRKDPVTTRETLGIYTKEDKALLVSAVSDAYKSVVESLSGEEVHNLVLEIPDKKTKKYLTDPKYLAVKKAAQEENWDEAKRAYIDSWEDKGWKKFIANSGEETVKRFVVPFLKMHEIKFLEDNGMLIEEETKDGKVKKFSPDKGREYLLEAVSRLEDKDRDEFYASAGKLYTSRIIKEAVEKAKK